MLRDSPFFEKRYFIFCYDFLPKLRRFGISFSIRFPFRAHLLFLFDPFLLQSKGTVVLRLQITVIDVMDRTVYGVLLFYNYIMVFLKLQHGFLRGSLQNAQFFKSFTILLKNLQKYGIIS